MERKNPAEGLDGASERTQMAGERGVGSVWGVEMVAQEAQWTDES